MWYLPYQTLTYVLLQHVRVQFAIKAFLYSKAQTHLKEELLSQKWQNKFLNTCDVLWGSLENKYV